MNDHLGKVASWCIACRSILVPHCALLSLFFKHASFKPLGSSLSLDSQTSESTSLSEPCGYSLGNSSSTTSMIGLRVTIRVLTHQLEQPHEPLQRSRSAILSKCLSSEDVHLRPYPTLEPNVARNVFSGHCILRIATRDTIHDASMLPTAEDCGIVPHPRVDPRFLPRVGMVCTGALFGSGKVKHHWCRNPTMRADQHIKRCV